MALFSFKYFKNSHHWQKVKIQSCKVMPLPETVFSSVACTSATNSLCKFIRRVSRNKGVRNKNGSELSAGAACRRYPALTLVLFYRFSFCPSAGGLPSRVPSRPMDISPWGALLLPTPSHPLLPNLFSSSLYTVSRCLSAFLSSLTPGNDPIF